MKEIILGIFLISSFFVVSNNAFAHCDTLDGPVVKDAKIALENKDLTPEKQGTFLCFDMKN